MKRKLIATTAMMALISTASFASTPDKSEKSMSKDMTGSKVGMNSSSDGSASMNSENTVTMSTAAATEEPKEIRDGQMAEQQRIFAFPEADPSVETETMFDKNGYAANAKNGVLASNLIGKYIYNGEGTDAQSIGDVNDVMMSMDGKARAVIVGVGGFLGLGEKNVAVDFNRLTWTMKDGERHLLIEASEEELEAAPSFDRSEMETDTAELQQQ